MFFNFLKVGIRSILKQKGFSLINIFGLSLALTVCMLIILMLTDQKSYDKFHIAGGRIFRVLSADTNSPFPYATSPLPLASALTTEYPGIEKATRFIRGVGGDITFNEKTVEIRGFFSDQDFFDVFSFSLDKGDRRTALTHPNSIVLSEAIARQLFGDENPVGKSVELVDRGLHYLGGNRNEPPPNPWGNFQVTGVIAGGQKSHLKFNALVSSSTLPGLHKSGKLQRDLTDKWDNFYECFTYVLLRPDATNAYLNLALATIARSKYSGIDNFKNFQFKTQRLDEITPGIILDNPTSYSLPAAAYYFLSFLAFVVIFAACLNYTNLSIAKSLLRVKEIAVRKVTGANRTSLVFQFLAESVLTCLLALVVAIAFLVFIREAFKDLWINRYLDFDLQSNIVVFLLFVVLAIGLGVVAGLYPALRLAKFSPTIGLNAGPGRRGGKWAFRKVVGVLQFVIALFFITTSTLIFSQFRHYLSFEYGFDPKSIVNVVLQGNSYDRVAPIFASVPGVSSVSGCDIIPATGTSNNVGLKTPGATEEYKWIGSLRTDENFIETLKLTLIAGSNFPPAGPSSSKFMIINEAAVTELGYKNPSEIIGQAFEVNDNNEIVQVVGVVKDFRYRLLIQEDKIGPLLLRGQGNFMFANVKVNQKDLDGAIAALESKWKAIDPIHQFKYEFYDDQLTATHQAIGDVVSILGFITFLIISISCLGLLGMASYASERRKKEVGIRKVLGAESQNIAMLLSSEFLMMLAVSVAIASPLSYFVNTLWLEHFPNRVDFRFGMLFVGIFIILILGILTIGSQTIRASYRNPVDALRSE